MSSRDPASWMWNEACGLLERADRMHRQFFVVRGTVRGPVWEPPVDLFETDRELWIIAALPGVEAGHLHIRLEGDALVIAGERTQPAELRDAAIHRMEIPYGRFERRIGLPAGRFELDLRDLVNGCLRLSLRKIR